MAERCLHTAEVEGSIPSPPRLIHKGLKTSVLKYAII